MNYNPDEEYNEYSDNEYQEAENNYSEVNEDFNESLENVINSYNPEEISIETLEAIATEVRDKVNDLKNIQLPPIEAEIDDINQYIEKRRSDLGKAKESSVFVNDISEDVEFHYSDHRAKHIEDEIKDQLNRRYNHEKKKFKILEELEELESRNNLCNYLLESYDVRYKIWVVYLAYYINCYKIFL